MIELMIVICILGILMAIAVPKFKTYQKRTRFMEVVSAVTAYKTPVHLVVQQGTVDSVDELDAGKYGIPANLDAGESNSHYVESVTVENGVITGTGTAAVDNAVFRLEASVVEGGGVSWSPDKTSDDSCYVLYLC